MNCSFHLRLFPIAIQPFFSASSLDKKSDMSEFASAINGASRLRYGKRSFEFSYPLNTNTHSPCVHDLNGARLLGRVPTGLIDTDTLTFSITFYSSYFTLSARSRRFRRTSPIGIGTACILLF
ncbi:unnamed protein product [Nippostrongylus brasiliensis]|uniref:Secreted protein n=1 Tax=Nippostrongylus brasiliensis TaxID=27835 RepID=A0A0N4XEZ0_NIPBR|nr:unnamed protein product [Nippostrongylus brasiliensis]